MGTLLTDVVTSTITHATLQIRRFIANKDCIPVTLCVEDEPVGILGHVQVAPDYPRRLL